MSSTYTYNKLYMQQFVYGVIDMSIKLTLNKILDIKEMSRYELSKRTKIPYQTIDKYYKNSIFRYDSYILNKICITLDCDISDIIEFKKD